MFWQTWIDFARNQPLKGRHPLAFCSNFFDFFCGLHRHLDTTCCGDDNNLFHLINLPSMPQSKVIRRPIKSTLHQSLQSQSLQSQSLQSQPCSLNSAISTQQSPCNNSGPAVCRRPRRGLAANHLYINTLKNPSYKSLATLPSYQPIKIKILWQQWWNQLEIKNIVFTDFRLLFFKTQSKTNNLLFIRLLG